MNEEFYLCKYCLYCNGTRFCDAERCADFEDHKDNRCDRYINDIYTN